MDTLENLSERSITIMNETREKANVASRIGSLFRDILLFIKGSVKEAPEDGKIYVRKDGEWIPVDEAPRDGKLYVQKDGEWVAVDINSGIEEAPADGKFYVRQNGEWVVLPPTNNPTSEITLSPVALTFDAAGN